MSRDIANQFRTLALEAFATDQAGRVKVRPRRAKLEKLGWFVNRDGVWDNPTMTRLKNGDVLHGVCEEVKIANSGKHGNPVWYGRASERRAWHPLKDVASRHGPKPRAPVRDPTSDPLDHVQFGK